MPQTAATGRDHPQRPFVARMSDVAGGLSGAITSIPGNIAIGFVALSPLGVDAQSNGIGAALLAVAVGGGLFTLVCRTRGLMAGGSMSFALVVAGVLTALLQLGVLAPGLAGFPGALATVALLTMLTGLCEAALAASGLGQLVAMLPYPVVAGIRNGTALLMIVLQIRPALGLVWDGSRLHWAHPAALAVSAATLALMLMPVRGLRKLPPALVAVLAGTTLHYVLAMALTPRGQAPLLSPLLDAPGGGLQHLAALRLGWAALVHLPLWTLAATLLPAALTIAVVSTLETLVGASVMQDITGEHGSSRADLFALAAANVGAGLCGTLPVTGGSSSSMAAWSSGGRSKAAGWVRAGVMLATVLLAGPVIGLLPTAALAGLVVGNGLLAFDPELLRLGRLVLARGSPGRLEMIGNLAVSLVVIGAAIAISLVAAVLTGVLLSALLFVATMSGRAVRRRYSNPGSRSRTFRSEIETEALRCHGAEIEVIELQGALFFGSANQLVREVEAAWAGGAHCVILDVRRVSQIDLSGARRILQMAKRYWQQGRCLSFAEFRPDSPVRAYYEAVGLWPQLRSDQIFATLGEALSAAEVVLLAAHDIRPTAATVNATDVLIRLGLCARDAEKLLQYAPERAYSVGSTIIHAGEQADALYILVEGEVEVSTPSGAGVRTRLATLTAGIVFGEAALLSGAPRSADVVALTPARCIVVDVAIVAHVRQAQPELAYHLMAAIAGQLASNLLMANVALRSTGE